MHIIVQSKTLAITEGLQQCIHRQARKLERLGVKISKVRVFLETLRKKRSDNKNASVTYAIGLPGKKEVVVVRQAADMYEAIVDATNRVIRQVRKAKERRLDAHRRLLLSR